MSNAFPWDNTTNNTSSQYNPQYETPNGAQNKVNISQEYLLHLLKLSVTGMSNGSEVAIARYSDPYGITYGWLKERLDASDQRQINNNDFNVKDFGAKGDGVTDDTNAIKSAINKAAVKGGVVLFPEGRFNITSTLMIPPKVILLGKGRTISVLVGTINGMDMVFIKSDVHTRTYNEIVTLGFIAGASNITAIKTKLSSSLRFEDLYFSGTNFNFYLDRGATFQIEGILVEGSATPHLPAGKSAFIDSSKTDYIFDIQITDYQIRNIGNGVQSPSILMNRAVGSFIDSYHVNDLGNADGVLFQGDCQGCKISSSIFVSSNDYAIKCIAELGSYPISMSITDVDIDQATRNGIQIDAGFWYTIKGCRLTTIGQHGVTVGTANVTIEGMIIVQCTSFGIHLHSNASNFIISNNHIEQTSVAILVDSGAIDNYMIYGNDLTVLNASKILNNSTGTNKLINNNLGIDSGFKKEYSASVVVVLTGGTAAETISVDIPAGLFSIKPQVGFISESTNSKFIGFYDYDNGENSSTKGKFMITKSDGTNLPSGPYRFSVLLKG